MRWPCKIFCGCATPLAFALLAVTPMIAAAASGDVDLVSVRLPNQTTANASSSQAEISADGRFAVFASDADDLVPGDTNGYADIFVETLSSGAIERVSVSTSGVQANNYCTQPHISADGRLVLFASTATNLTATDDTSRIDYFIHDRQTGTTQRLTFNGQSLPVDDAGPVLSGNGRYLVFTSLLEMAGDNNHVPDVYVYDRQNSSMDRISVSSSGQVANQGPINGVPRISADGRYVVFTSPAINLVAGDTNGSSDAFLRDRQNGTTERISVNSAEQQGNQGAAGGGVISPDGRFVAFNSASTNLVANDTNGTYDVFVRDRQLGTTTLVSLGSGGVQAGDASSVDGISDDGRFVAFDSAANNLVPGDTNGEIDYFIRDRQMGVTQRLDVSASGAQANAGAGGGGISADGSLAIFVSGSVNLIARDRNESADVFVRDLQTPTTVLVSRAVIASNAANGGTDYPSPAVSGDGRLVAFSSQAANIVASDNNHQGDVFVRDLAAAVTERIGGGPAPANAPGARVESHLGGMSANGRFVVFQSWAADLVPNDTTGNGWDIFVRDRQTGGTEIVSRDPSGAQVTELSSEGQDLYWDNVISADGRYVAWDTTAQVVPEDTNEASDIYLRDRQAGTTEWISRRIKGNIGNVFSRSGFPALSSDGRYVAFASDASNMVLNDTNKVRDIFVRDRQTGIAERVSVATDGRQSMVYSDGPAISGDGRYVTFYSSGSDLVPSNGAPYQIFVHDRQTGVTELVVSSEKSGVRPTISADGRFIAYTLSTTDLATLVRHSDVYQYDRYTGVIDKVNDDPSGQLAAGSAFQPALSPSGRYAAFDAMTYDSRNDSRINTYRRDSGIPSVVPFALTPTNMNFGTRQSGSASNRTVTVINTGSKALALTSIALIGQNAAQFALTSHCGSTLAVGASCLVQVAFRPTAAGAKTAELRVSATGLQARTVVLKGNT